MNKTKPPALSRRRIGAQFLDALLGPPGSANVRGGTSATAETTPMNEAIHPSRRNLMAGAAALPFAVGASAAVSAKPNAAVMQLLDPELDAELLAFGPRLDAAHERELAAMTAEDQIAFTDGKALEAARLHSGAVCDATIEIEQEMCSFQAETVWGLFFKARYCREDPDISASIVDDLNALAMSLGTDPADIPTNKEVTVASDDHLRDLGRRLDQAWSNQKHLDAVYSGDGGHEADTAWTAAYDACGGLVCQIEQVPATTIEGLAVKTRAVAWCLSGGPIVAEKFGGSTSTDIRIATSILRDILAMG